MSTTVKRYRNVCYACGKRYAPDKADAHLYRPYGPAGFCKDKQACRDRIKEAKLL